MAEVISFEERVDRWIDALCAGVRVFEDRALDPTAFDGFVDEGPTDEIRIRMRRPPLRTSSAR